MPTPTHCPHGHAYDEVNTFWQVRYNGHKTAGCRTCRKARLKAKSPYHTERMRAWRAANPERSNRNWTQQRLRKKKWLEHYKLERGCSRCPEHDPVCLDFHHRNPYEKEMTISLGIARASLHRLQNEIAKCDILCANCHRKLHAAERAAKEKVG